MVSPVQRTKSGRKFFTQSMTVDKAFGCAGPLVAGRLSPATTKIKLLGSWGVGISTLELVGSGLRSGIWAAATIAQNRNEMASARGRWYLVALDKGGPSLRENCNDVPKGDELYLARAFSKIKFVYIQPATYPSQRADLEETQKPWNIMLHSAPEA